MIKTKYLFGVLSLATCQSVFAQDFLSLQQCREMALSYNQDLKAAMHKVTAYEALHRSAKSDLYPKISASGDATYTGKGLENLSVRYQLACQQKIEITQTPESFTVKVPLIS